MSAAAGRSGSCGFEAAFPLSVGLPIRPDKQGTGRKAVWSCFQAGAADRNFTLWHGKRQRRRQPGKTARTAPAACGNWPVVFVCEIDI